MKLNSLAIVLSMLLLPVAYSVPTNKLLRTGDIKEVNSGLSSSSDVSSVPQLQTEFPSVSIHSYLKELYKNLTNPDQSLSSIEEMEVSTIRSYKNQAKRMYIDILLIAYMYN